MTSKLVIRESESPRPAASSILNFTNDEFHTTWPQPLTFLCLKMVPKSLIITESGVHSTIE